MPWFANIVIFLATKDLSAHWSAQDKIKFLSEVKNFYCDDPYMFKYCLDKIFQICILNNEVSSFIKFCHQLEACEGSLLIKKKDDYKIIKI